jgi:hypothetical protein
MEELGHIGGEKRELRKADRFDAFCNVLVARIMRGDAEIVVLCST